MHRINDERKILELLSQGNEFVFTQLFHCYRARVFGVAMRFLKSRERAEEVVQAVFLRVWMNRQEMVNVLNFEGYLFTMTRNKVFDCIKDIARETAAKREFAYTVQYVNGTDYLLIEKQYQELLQEVVSQLPPQQKQIFRLARIEGLTHQAIAEQMNISRLTVKTHMAKALQTIRQNLLHHLTAFFLLLVISWIHSQ